MPELYSVFFDEPLSTFSRVCQVLGETSASRRPAYNRERNDYSVVRTYLWNCGCRALICKGERCCIALCERHGQRDGNWLRIESAS